MSSSMTRRDFLTMGVAGLTISAAGAPRRVNAQAKGSRDIHVFSKHLQWLDYKHMAEFAAECGFDGVDLTVRPGGHVEPARVTTDLPAAVKAVQRAGKKVGMITTAITDANAPDTVPILETASRLGIRCYRMGWIDYDPNKTIEANLDDILQKIRALAELNRKYKIKGGYQNHAGVSFGAPVWDLARILNQVNSPWLGCQYDIRHAMVEGATAWKLGFEYIKPRINSLDIKDFAWKQADGKWITENVPLGKGMVDYETFLPLARTLQGDIPISMHFEYSLGGAEHGGKSPTMSAEDIMRLMKADLQYLKERL
ncbi:MAG TPA: sugar phosphate isomerase/epimerase family protein [Cyclobacteriaceae bacterium]